MNEFSLLKALDYIRRNLLISIALFFVANWSLPNLNLIENQYKIIKIIKTGQYPDDLEIPLLQFVDINGILSSTAVSKYLQKTIQTDQIPSFKISENEVGNIFLTLKGNDPDTIIKTADALMQKLQDIDNIEIEKKLNVIQARLNVDYRILQMLEKSDNQYIFSDKDIQEWANLQKKYDLAMQDEDEFDQKYKINLVNIMRYKVDDNKRKIALDSEILLLDNEIKRKQALLNNFSKVSYLFPLSRDEVSLFYPNAIVFFGLSLLVTLFYNLIMLNVVFILHKKRSESL
jgi:hypothetical protein